MPISLFGPGEQKTSYTSVEAATIAGYEVVTRQRDFVFVIENAIGQPWDGESVHILILNPKTATLTEPAATPVQDTRGGVYKETKGVTKRRYTIAGTFGVNPLKFLPIDTGSAMGDLMAPITGGINDMMDALSGLLGSTPYQGLEEMNRFRDKIIHKYYALNRDWSEGVGSEVWLAMYVIQDGKKYYLEPANMTIPRTSATPATYPYQLDFTVLSETQSGIAQPDPRNFWDIIDDAKEAWDTVSDTLDNWGKNVEAGYNSTWQKFENAMNGSRWDEMDEFANTSTSRNDSDGYEAVVGKNGVVDDLLVTVEDIYTELWESQDELGLDISDPSTYLGESGAVTASADIDRLNHHLDDPMAGYGDDDNSPITLLRGIKNAEHVLCLIKSAGVTADIGLTGKMYDPSDWIEDSVLDNQISNPSSPVSNDGYDRVRPSRSTNAGGDYYFAQSIKGRQAALVPVQIRQGQTIRDIAEAHIGTPEAYRLLATINDLSPPYIASASSEGVLTWGDMILVPKRQADTTVESGDIFSTEKIAMRKTGPMLPKTQLTAIDRFFGVDIYFDFKSQNFKVDQRADLEVSFRESQIEQFLRIYAEVTRGLWRADRKFGIMPKPGFGSTRIAVAVARINAKNGLLADPRVESIKTDTAYLRGNTMVIYLEPKLARTGQYATIGREYTV